MKNEKTGEAGHEKSQDCKVFVKIMESGGIQIKIQSKLEKMFGESIKRSVEEEICAMGVEHAYVEVKDYSSFDFAIRARVRTAVRRAGI